MEALNSTLEDVIYHLAFTLDSFMRVSELADLLGVSSMEINRVLAARVYAEKAR